MRSLNSIPALPEQGEQAVARAEAVVGIAWEVAAQHFFLVQEAEHDQRDDEYETEQRPPGAQRKRRQKQHKNRAEVHRMSNEAIRSGGDHSVSLLDLDGAGSKAVLFHDPKRYQIAGEYEDLRKNGQPTWDARPAEAVVQTGDKQGCKDN